MCRWPFVVVVVAAASFVAVMTVNSFGSIFVEHYSNFAHMLAVSHFADQHRFLSSEQWGWRRDVSAQWTAGLEPNSIRTSKEKNTKKRFGFIEGSVFSLRLLAKSIITRDSLSLSHPLPLSPSLSPSLSLIFYNEKYLGSYIFFLSFSLFLFSILLWSNVV